MTKAYVKGKRALGWLTRKLDAEAKEAVWKAAAEVSAGYSGQHLNEFIRPLSFSGKMKILLPWAIWVNLIENPMLMVGGVVAVTVLTLNLIFSIVSPDTKTPAEQIQRAEELKQVQEFLKGKQQ